MNLSANDFKALNPCLLRLYRELETEAHQKVMLEVLNELVPADSVVLNLFEVTTGRYTVVTLPAQLARPDEVELVSRYLNQSPFPAYYVATGDAQWKMTTDFMPVEDFHATTLHREGLSRWGINQQICGMLAFESATAHALTINRTQAGFTERERLLLNTLHPHLVTSYLNALAFGRSQQSLAQLRGVMETAPGAYGYMNADGSVAWLQERARMWLGEFFATEPLNDEGLPTTVREMVARSQTDATAPQHLEKMGTQDRMVLCLSVSALGGWILRLDRMPLTPHLKLRAVPGLTTRENEVLRWMAEGKRNAEIAAILGLSARTVEKHVEAVLAALNAENRATAIVRAMEMSGPGPA